MKKREMALISSPDTSTLPAGTSSGDPRIPTTSSPTQVEAAPTSFHFSEPRPENVRDSSETLMHTSLYFSRIEEEMQTSEMESSSIFDKHTVSREEDSVLETERTQWESAGLPQVLSDQDRYYHEERTEFINIIMGRSEEEAIDLMTSYDFDGYMARHFKKSKKIRKEIRKLGRRKKNTSRSFKQEPHDKEGEKGKVGGKSQVSRGADQKAAAEEEDCLEDEEGAAADAAAAAEGRGDEANSSDKKIRTMDSFIKEYMNNDKEMRVMFKNFPSVREGFPNPKQL